MGASSQALMLQSPLPLEVGAAKSRLGHTEACAGLVGVVALLEQGLTQHAAPVLHLREMNTAVQKAAGTAKAVRV
jgi:acyl transferase domain-containing protein